MFVSLSPIYECLLSRGGMIQDEYILIGDWPVQFLTPANDLEREAVDQAITANVEGIAARIVSAEHLMAIALNTGRAKDHSRGLQFIEQPAYDPAKLKDILQRYGLDTRWQSFEIRFLKG